MGCADARLVPTLGCAALPHCAWRPAGDKQGDFGSEGATLYEQADPLLVLLVPTVGCTDLTHGAGRPASDKHWLAFVVEVSIFVIGEPFACTLRIARINL